MEFIAAKMAAFKHAIRVAGTQNIGLQLGGT
jgi:hypothetical protein